jgi:hypothetical protein
VNQINAINENAPPAAAQDLVDIGLIVSEATSTISAMQAAAQASLAQASASLDEKRQHIEKVFPHALLRTRSLADLTLTAGSTGLLPV